ncbi:MAG: radical SAM protein [Alphaproteobacteria bacterium]|nr:radical SAM protein [Alphaproteobacteria bacterium]
MGEVEQLHRTYRHTGFMFYDDELNVSKMMVELMNALSDLQSRLGVEFRLRGFVKAELFTDAQAAAMYRAGFRWLLCGFEAAHPRILENIEKRASLDDNSRAVEIAKRHGFKVKALMSVGHPGENAETVGSVHDWLVRVGVDDFDYTIITTYPGTPYYDFSVPHESQRGVWTYVQPKSGDRRHAYEVDFSTTPDYYKGDPDGGYRSYVFTDHLSAEELVRLRDWVERETRAKLKIPFNSARSALRFEHSMGQGLPDFILRTARAGQSATAN